MQRQPGRRLEQHIAVFGESGSGKTVMLSSFYGATQESDFLRKSQFNVVSDDIGQGARLHRNYLGMRDSARVPAATRFSATSYSFSVKLKGGDAKTSKKSPLDALRLVWHDYPGEWFEEGVSGPEEAQRRVDTFRSLLTSDVALLLVDGQRLLDNAGEESRYLKSMLSNVRNGLLALKDELLRDGKPLVGFPRIWILALSKADLLPALNVFAFRDLVIDQACDDVDELRSVIAGLVEGSEALAVGEDFMLLSSAKFDAAAIKVSERVGLDLILPLAAVLPLERHVRWAQGKQIPPKVAEYLLRSAGTWGPVLIARIVSKLPGPWGMAAKFVDPKLVNDAAKRAGDKLSSVNSKALATKDNLIGTLNQFGIDLDRGEEQGILIRSLR